MSYTVLFWLLSAVIGSGGLIGLLTLWARSQKKMGQAQEDAEIAQKDAANAQRATQVLVSERSPDATVKRLRDGTF
jgi:hypothetical protein